MNKVERKRLEKLIGFLEVLPRNRFDFAVVRRERQCGTVACALGWTPKVFPNLVKWGSGEDELRYRGHKCTWAVIAEELFGLGRLTSVGLFSAHSQCYVSQRLRTMTYAATPKQVARMLRQFLKLADAGEIVP